MTVVKIHLIFLLKTVETLDYDERKVSFWTNYKLNLDNKFVVSIFNYQP